MLVHHQYLLWIICHKMNILDFMSDKYEFFYFRLDLNLNCDLDQVKISNRNMMTWNH